MNSDNINTINIRQTSSGKIIMKNYLLQKASTTQVSQATNIISQYVSEKEANSLWAIVAIIIAVGILLMSPEIGAGVILKDSANNGVFMLMMAALWLLLANMYLTAECVNHVFPIFRFPGVLILANWGIPIIPSWCDTQKKMADGYFVAWGVFILMLIMAFSAQKMGSGSKLSGAIPTSTATKIV
jgi:hypothetical protein